MIIPRSNIDPKTWSLAGWLVADPSELRVGIGNGNNQYRQDNPPKKVHRGSLDSLHKPDGSLDIEKLRQDILGSTPVMYHGTSTAVLDSIKSQGLVPKAGKGADVWLGHTPMPLGGIQNHHDEVVIDSRKSSVFVTEQLRTAEQFSRYAATVNHADPVILKVQIPEKALQQLHPDEATDPEMKAWRFEGKIPPSWITGYSKWTPGSGGLPKFSALVGTDGRTIYVVILATPPEDLKTAAATELDPRYAVGNGNNQYRKDQPTKDDALYHGTAGKFLQSILKHGLIPDQQNRVFLTTDLNSARAYATNAHASGAGTVLEVHIPTDQTQLLHELKSARGLPPRLVFKGIVKPEWIRVHSKFDKKSGWKTLEGGTVIYIVVADDGDEPKTAAAVELDLEPVLDAFTTIFTKLVTPKLMTVLQEGGAVAGTRLPTQLKAAVGNGNNQYRQDNPTKEVYHGTVAGSLKSILRDGLTLDKVGETYPQFAKAGHVYVTQDLDLAKEYAVGKIMDQAFQETTPVVLEIEIPGTALKKLGPDQNFGPASRSLQFKGAVPPEWIKGVYVGDITDVTRDFTETKWKKVDPKQYRAASETQTVYAVLFLGS